MIDCSVPNQSTFNTEFSSSVTSSETGLNFGCWKPKSANGIWSLNIWINWFKCLLDRLDLENIKLKENLFRRFLKKVSYQLIWKYFCGSAKKFYYPIILYSYNPVLCIELCPPSPQKRCVLVLNHLASNVTLFGTKIFTEIIKLKFC